MLLKVAWLIINRHSIPPWHPQVVNASAVRASMTTSPTTATTLPPLILLLPNSVSGHHIAQLRLIFRAIPSRRAPNSPGTDLFLVYAQCFEIVPQFLPTGLGQSNEKDPYPEPSTGMHLLKRARQADGSIMGDIVPLAQLQTLVDLVLRFGKQANRQLAKVAK